MSFVVGWVASTFLGFVWTKSTFLEKTEQNLKRLSFGKYAKLYNMYLEQIRSKNLSKIIAKRMNIDAVSIVVKSAKFLCNLLVTRSVRESSKFESKPTSSATPTTTSSFRHPTHRASLLGRRPWRRFFFFFTHCDNARRYGFSPTNRLSSLAYSSAHSNRRDVRQRVE